MQYEFTRGINADTPTGEARSFFGGEVIEEAEIASGCLESCLRMGIVKPFVAEAVEESDQEQVERTPQTRSRKKLNQKKPAKAKEESPLSSPTPEDPPQQEDGAAGSDSEQEIDGRQE